jgi:hypothetical protein
LRDREEKKKSPLRFGKHFCTTAECTAIFKKKLENSRFHGEVAPKCWHIYNQRSFIIIGCYTYVYFSTLLFYNSVKRKRYPKGQRCLFRYAGITSKNKLQA